MKLWPWRRKKKIEPTQVMDLGDDPLDPHGDGTLRPGDPVYDLMMGDAGVVFANRRDDGKWDVSTRDPGD